MGDQQSLPGPADPCLHSPGPGREEILGWPSQHWVITWISHLLRLMFSQVVPCASPALLRWIQRVSTRDRYPPEKRGGGTFNLFGLVFCLPKTAEQNRWKQLLPLPQVIDFLHRGYFCLISPWGSFDFALEIPYPPPPLLYFAKKTCTKYFWVDRKWFFLCSFSIFPFIQERWKNEVCLSALLSSLVGRWCALNPLMRTAGHAVDWGFSCADAGDQGGCPSTTPAVEPTDKVLELVLIGSWLNLSASF